MSDDYESMSQSKLIGIIKNLEYSRECQKRKTDKWYRLHKKVCRDIANIRAEYEEIVETMQEEIDTILKLKE